MSKYNKAFVPLLMGIIYLLNSKFGIDIPLSEAQASILVAMVTSATVWAVPNK